MVRLRSLLIAGLIVVPTLLQAADFKWYSSHRQGWWFVDELSDVDSLDSKMYSTFTAKNNNTFIGASRTGAKVQTDKYAGQVEIAMRHPKNGTPTCNVRLAWGQWNFTKNIGLTIGITDAPFTIKSAPQGYWETVDQGKFSGKRSHNDKVMLYQLNLNNLGPVSAKFALQNNECDVKSITVKSYAAGETVRTANIMNEGPVPHMEFQVGYKSDVLNANLVGAFQTFNHTYMTTADSAAGLGYDHSVAVNSFAFGGDVNVKFSIISILAGFSFGVNNENMGINTSYTGTSYYGPVSANVGDDSVKISPTTRWGTSNTFSPAAVGTLVNGEIEDATSWGLPISVTAEFSKKFSLVAGFGMCSVKESATRSTATTAIEKETMQMSFYVNAKLKPVNALTLQPEIGYIDFDMNKNLGVFPQLYFGVHTQVDL